LNKEKLAGVSNIKPFGVIKKADVSQDGRNSLLFILSVSIACQRLNTRKPLNFLTWFEKKRVYAAALDALRAACRRR
jgi:hypothetical protein